jgi:hypothetical protein
MNACAHALRISGAAKAKLYVLHVAEGGRPVTMGRSMPLAGARRSVFCATRLVRFWQSLTSAIAWNGRRRINASPANRRHAIALCSARVADLLRLMN